MFYLTDNLNVKYIWFSEILKIDNIHQAQFGYDKMATLIGCCEYKLGKICLDGNL